MTTIMRQASSCIHGLRPFLEDILTRRFDELGFTDDYMDGEVGDMSAEYMSKLQIIESVRQLLAFTEGMSNDDTKVEELIKAVKNKQLCKTIKLWFSVVSAILCAICMKNFQLRISASALFTAA